MPLTRNAVVHPSAPRARKAASFRPSVFSLFAKALALTLCLLLSPASALPTTLQRMSLDELAAAAPAIARVRIVSNESRMEAGRIWTFSQMEVLETLKGTLPAHLTLRLLGGRTQGLVSKVEGVPRFAPQEEAILFLQPTRLGDWSVVSWVQGTFRIARSGAANGEKVTQDTAAVAMFDPATRRFARGDVRNLPLREFRTRLTQALTRNARSDQ